MLCDPGVSDEAARRRIRPQDAKGPAPGTRADNRHLHAPPRAARPPGLLNSAQVKCAGDSTPWVKQLEARALLHEFGQTFYILISS